LKRENIEKSDWGGDASYIDDREDKGAAIGRLVEGKHDGEGVSKTTIIRTRQKLGTM
jgi:hypothetical protein